MPTGWRLCRQVSWAGVGCLGGATVTATVGRAAHEFSYDRGDLVGTLLYNDLLTLLGGSAVGYVYQKNQIYELGKQIQQREKHLKDLRAGNGQLSLTLQTLQSSVYLEKRVRELNLGLVQPAQSQIITIVEVPATTLTNSESLDVQTVGHVALK